MSTLRSTLARSRVRAGVLAGLAATAALAAALTGGLVDVGVASPPEALAHRIGELRGQAGAMRWETRIATDAAAQSQAADHTLARFLSPVGAGWARSVVSEPVPVSVGASGASGTSGTSGASGTSEASDAVVLVADPGLPARSSLVEGAWPDDPAAAADARAAGATAGAVQAAAAARLGIAVGDVVRVGDDRVAVLVTGTWRADRPTDPAWFGDPLVAAGADGEASGPILVDEALVATLPAAVSVRWTTTAPRGPIAAERLADYRTALGKVLPALRSTDDLGDTGVEAAGALAPSLDRLLAAESAGRAVTPLALVLVVVTALATVLRLSSLLAETRRRETLLLRARGASAGRLAARTAVEVFVVAAPAAALGVALAELALTALRPGETRAAGLAWIATSAVVVATAFVAAAVAWRAVTRPIVRGAGEADGRRTAAVASGSILVIAVAAVAVWQFVSHGSPLVADGDGTVRVDPVAQFAPVAVVVALGLLAVAAITALLGVAERVASRAVGLLPALPSAVSPAVRRSPPRPPSSSCSRPPRSRSPRDSAAPGRRPTAPRRRPERAATSMCTWPGADSSREATRSPSPRRSPNGRASTWTFRRSSARCAWAPTRARSSGSGSGSGSRRRRATSSRTGRRVSPFPTAPSGSPRTSRSTRPRDRPEASRHGSGCSARRALRRRSMRGRGRSMRPPRQPAPAAHPDRLARSMSHCRPSEISASSASTSG
ncbi:hypothetical protein ET445_07645 [Agromyces protaetiae]|uniref:ABC3 transporter permease C-terminal domain-containing protein n=1 Tax=Agromyces protaetiae TaxID=2509455 RepID=A0A4P6FFP2_9MICO|nr:FtsX-like permease family protein [Agromyces protaetiae]QAY73239.1 hypothetical protein ET445_07645 [Agromyces protaetiae]